jgi:hypothetical protein
LVKEPALTLPREPANSEGLTMKIKFVGALVAAGSLAVAFASPAAGHDLSSTNGCTEGWSYDYNPSSKKDRNGDGWVCYQVHHSFVFRDNHVH